METPTSVPPIPSFGVSVSKLRGGILELQVKVGEILYLLGPNGSGKSSLALLFAKQHPNSILRLSAHRQTWLESSSHNVSPHQRNNLVGSIHNEDTQEVGRWRDQNAQSRVNLAIFNMIGAENARARKIAAAVEGETSTLDDARKQLSPVRSLNKILRLSNLSLEISVSDTGDEQVNVRKLGGEAYGIQFMSDGERNALLLAANVLTAKPGTLILIDEPERHLHRSIIAPLLTNLFAERSDCAFVIATHEVDLPLDRPKAQTVLLHSCEYRGALVHGWDLDLMPANTDLPDDAKRTILGERKKILFIEGKGASLDKPLYSLIFPNVSVIARDSWKDVAHSVATIRHAQDLLWVKAFGLVDNDSRSPDEIAKLKTESVYALAVYSVESLYYHHDVQKRIAERQAAVNGRDAQEALKSARAAALTAIKKQREHLGQRAAEKVVRFEVMSALGTRQQLFAKPDLNVSVQTQSILANELAVLDAAITKGEIETIISRYPVRETGALDKIAEELGFPDREHYEGAVLKLMIDDATALTFLKSLFDTLPADISAA